MSDLDAAVHDRRWRKCEHGVFQLRIFIDGFDKGYGVVERIPVPDLEHPWRERKLGVVYRANASADEVAERVAKELWPAWHEFCSSLEEHDAYAARSRGFVHYYDTNSGWSD